MLHFVIIISSFCIKLNYEIFVFCFTNIKGSDKLQFVCLIGGTRRPQVRTRPQLGRQIAVYPHDLSQSHKFLIDL